MNATLNFDLTDDGDAFDRAINGHKYHAALLAWYNHLRTQDKHGDTETVAWEDLREQFGSILEDEGVELW